MRVARAILATYWRKKTRSPTKKMKPTKMERPRNRPSDFINFHVRCDSRLVETLPLAKCLYHGGVFWHFVSIKIYDFSCFSAVVVQSMLSTLSKKYVF